MHLSDMVYISSRSQTHQGRPRMSTCTFQARIAQLPKPDNREGTNIKETCFKKSIIQTNAIEKHTVYCLAACEAKLTWHNGDHKNGYSERCPKCKGTFHRFYNFEPFIKMRNKAFKMPVCNNKKYVKHKRLVRVCRKHYIEGDR